MFLVRPQDAQQVGIEHMASHIGLKSIGFRVYYETVAGKDYIPYAEEVGLPG